MCSTPKPKHSRIERGQHENGKFEIDSNGCANIERWIREPFFYMQNNANGVDEMHLNKHAMFSEKKLNE